MDIQQLLLDAIAKNDAITTAHKRAGIKLKEALAELRAVESTVTPVQNVNITVNLNLLTRREREIFMLIGEGLDVRAIAERLGLSHKTIEAQRYTMKKKLGFPTSHDLIRAARGR